MKRKTRVSRGRKAAGIRIAGRRVAGEKSASRKIVGRKSSGGKSASRKIVGLRASEDGMGQDPMAKFMGWRRSIKKRITLFLDADVLAWFKEKPKYQKEISRALREVMREGREDSAQ
jgi:uncharacterized protein (DUF4415 family)